MVARRIDTGSSCQAGYTERRACHMAGRCLTLCYACHGCACCVFVMVSRYRCMLTASAIKTGSGQKATRPSWKFSAGVWASTDAVYLHICHGMGMHWDSAMGPNRVRSQRLCTH